MALSASVEIPLFEGTKTIDVHAGSSVVFIGANGAGKTRLGVFIDHQLSHSSIEVHRIGAHRSLRLDPNVVASNREQAENRLFYGHEGGGFQHKVGHRYHGQPETVLLNDFDHVLMALYAENNDVSIAYREQCLAKPRRRPPTPATKMDNLKSIWEKVLPHRRLLVLGGNVKTSTIEGYEYSASDMSDGERVIFYLIAQSLLAKPDTLLIFDEPELHINKAILAKLWDEIESARADCGFLYITHDIEFAASRHAATKYALRSFRKLPSEGWDIELVPDDQQLPDDVLATIIGSRQPVLFVEGDGGSLDSSIYRRAYDSFTVIPVGSCEQVIHTVASFIARKDLHRIGCAGLVDADGRSSEEVAHLQGKGVYCLPVSEVENLLLLPNVFMAAATALKFDEATARSMLASLRSHVMKQAAADADAICLRYTKRRIDAEMKKIGLKSADIGSLASEFESAASAIDAQAVFTGAQNDLSDAVARDDYEKVLHLYDNKGLLAEAAKLLGMNQKSLEEFLGRSLRSKEGSDLHAALRGYLPSVTARPSVQGSNLGPSKPAAK